MPATASQDLNGKWKVSASHTGPAELEIPAEFIYKEVSSVTMTITSEPTSADTKWITPLGEPISLDDIERKYTSVVLDGFKYVVTNDNFEIKPYIPPTPYLNAELLRKKPFTSGGGSTNLSISSNTAWEITLNPEDDWVTVAPTMVGAGNDRRSVTVAENTGAARNCLITISGAGIDEPTRVTLRQNKGEALFLTVTPSETEFTSGGGSATLTIASNTSWEITGLPSWVSIVDGPSSGSGNADRRISVEANTSTSSTRYAEITVTGEGVSDATITITQAKAEDKFLTAILPQTAFTSAGGSVELQITSNTSWGIFYPAEHSSWIRVANPTGSGTTQRGITIVGNTSTTNDRSSVISISGEGVTTIEIPIVQEKKVTYYLNAELSNYSFNAYPNSPTLSISSNTSWTIETEDEWISVPETAGTGDKSQEVHIEENVHGYSRDGSLIVSSPNAESIPLNIEQSWLPHKYPLTVKCEILEGTSDIPEGTIFNVDVYTDDTAEGHRRFDFVDSYDEQEATVIATITGETQHLNVRVVVNASVEGASMVLDGAQGIIKYYNDVVYSEWQTADATHKVTFTCNPMYSSDSAVLSVNIHPSFTTQ